MLFSSQPEYLARIPRQPSEPEDNGHYDGGDGIHYEEIKHDK
jgi:hypothetical protein